MGNKVILWLIIKSLIVKSKLGSIKVGTITTGTQLRVYLDIQHSNQNK